MSPSRFNRLRRFNDIPIEVIERAVRRYNFVSPRPAQQKGDSRIAYEFARRAFTRSSKTDAERRMVECIEAAIEGARCSG